MGAGGGVYNLEELKKKKKSFSSPPKLKGIGLLNFQVLYFFLHLSAP